MEKRKSSPLALVICPTRELAEQVMEMIYSFAKYIPNVRILGIYGALKSIAIQQEEIEKGVDILVCTPGRLITLKAEEKVNLNLSEVKILVLDEVDRMLDMGLFPELKKVYTLLPKPKKREKHTMQVMMFTATLVSKVFELVGRFAPRHQRIDLNWDLKPPEKVRQVIYKVHTHRKYSLLLYLLRRKGPLKENKILVFCRTKKKSDKYIRKIIFNSFF